ncbi:protein kinase domain-containing protein [Rubrivirga sp. IMCC45206]|uniref:serine/threonine-protein kinase n=1 Tax=Rubrivirga sp. IMCC45206 TaxID=3391614 RepID=UPI0039901F0D
MADVTNRWTQVQALFERALDRPPDERTAWLRAAAGNDPDLYTEVANLLEGYDHQHTLLDGRATDLFSDRALDDALVPSHTGERVGSWVLRERIGTGGMGAVYRADRADGFEQTAALKRLKPGMDSDAVLARFRAERQILARLEHPGIARLLDGGVASDGRPYFAMELVEGEPITDAADDRQLGVEARLALFARVCDAVAYAHQNLVVHRDLKPSNVLVTPAGAPKLLDFGIARVLSDDDAHLTQTGHRLLTPAYAAPEQVRGEPPTTATDVYALGGLLYRLLCGAAPLDTGGSRAQAERAVLEGQPERPSARVTDAAACQRGTTAAALAKRLQGDLDTICLKALRTEPERRYGSAAELGADVRRHLAGQPVAARPATRRYRARLFVRRHRAGVLATAAAVLVAVALTAFYTTRVAAERDRAESEARRSDEVVGFLQTLLLSASPYEEPGEELTARELVDRGAERIGELADEPQTQAALQVLIGDVYLDLGRAEDAIPLYRGALATRQALGLRVEAANTARQLGRALRDVEQYDEAERLLRQSLANLETLGADPADIAFTRRHLGSLIRDRGDYETAESMYREALATARTLRPPDLELEEDITTSLVIVLRAQDKDGEALDLMGEMVESGRRTYPDGHPMLATSLSTYATLLSRAERGDEAVAAAREAYRMFRAAHPDTTHPDIAAAVQGLGIAYRADGRLAEADAAYVDAVGRLRAAHGPGDPRVLAAMRAHGTLKEERGDPEAAAVIYREAARNARSLPRQEAILWSYLADNRARARAWPEAQAAFHRSVAVLRAEGLDDDLDGVVTDFADAAREVGRPDLADAALRERP